MSKIRSELGNTLFKYAAFVYEPNNPMRKKMGNALFKLAAKVSPDKIKKVEVKVKEAKVKVDKAAKKTK